MNDRERLEMRRAIAIITASVLMLLLLIGGLFAMREARAQEPPAAKTPATPTEPQP